jgi:large subunit ribosomal protein L25
MAMIQQVQHDPVSGSVLHIDFHSVKMDEEITAQVVVEAQGDAEGVKAGGLLEQSMRSIEVSCMPKDLPEVIKVDVSALTIGDSIHVGQISLPAGVEALSDKELTVFLVAAPTVQEEEEAVAATVEGAATEPEVLKEKKEEEPAAEEAK